MSADAALAARVLLAIGLSLALTFTLGRLLLRLDWRGSGVVGGICAGIALGPMILGALAPSLHDRLNVGGHEAQRMYDALLEERDAELAALEDVGVSAIALDERSSDYDQSLEGAAERIEEEKLRFRSTPLAVAISLGLVILMLGAWLRAGFSLAGGRVGLLVAGMTALVWAVGARKMLDLDLVESIGASALILAGCVWGRGAWRFSAGVAAIVISLILLAISGHWEAAWPAIVAIGVGVLLTRISALPERAKARWSFTAHAILAPILIAIVVSFATLPTSRDEIIFVIVVGLLVGDAHFVMGWIVLGWIEGGRRFLYPATTWFNLRAQGWASTSIILLGIVMAAGVQHGREVPSAVMLAVIAGALMTELTRPTMHRMLAQMRSDTKGFIRP